MEADDVFVTKLDIGSFIVLVTLINELVLFPIFEALKNKLTNAIAIHNISNSENVTLRSDTWFSTLLGVTDNVKPDSFSFALAYAIKVFFRGLIIGMLVYWESSAEQVTFATISNQQLTRGTLEGRDQLNGIRIMSEIPFSGLSENEIIRMVTFSPHGVEQNASYVVLDGEDYFFTGDDSCTSVIDGRLTIYLSRAELSGKNISRICLDGKEKRPTEIATELNIQSRTQKHYFLGALTLQSFIETDLTSIIYKVIASHDGEDKTGYAALTRNSHQNGNTFWSFYGVVIGKQGNTLEYLNIPLSNLTIKPCGTERLGTWKFSKGLTICPDGTEVQAPTGTIDLPHVADANWTMPSSKRFEVELSKLALQWVAETPFSDYVAKNKLAEEVWSRISRQVYFVSDFSDTIELPNTEKVQYTQTSRKRVIITTAVLITILVIFLVFLIVERIEMRRHRIKMNFCDIGSVLQMWSAEVNGKPSSTVCIGLIRGPNVSVGTVNRRSESISEP